MQTSLPINIITLEDESYHLMVEATINSNNTAHLIIDTGASKTVFDQSFIKPFVSEIEHVEDNNSSGINAMITEAHTGIIKQVAFNELIINDYQCLMLDLSHINELYKKYADQYVAGLLGSDFLLKYNAVINYNSKTLSLNE